MVNIPPYDPLAAGSYIELPKELNNSMKGLINIQNTDNKCLMWCHVRLLNARKSHPETVTSKADKDIAASLDYSDINFPVNAREPKKIEERFNINVNILAYDNENKKIYPLYISEKFIKQLLNALLITDEDKSHYVFIKDIEKLLSLQLPTKNVHKKHICLHCLQNFTSEDVLNKHKELCIKINGTQAAIYDEGIINFSKYEKLLPVPFRIYADTECSLRKIDYQLSHHTKFYQHHVPNSIAAKLVCIDDRFTKPIKFFTGKQCFKEFFEWIFERYGKCPNMISKYFTKN